MTIYTLIKRVIHWTLSIVTVLYIITGFGITEPKIIESITFGLLTKNLSFKIHNNLWIPFVASLTLHIFWSLILKFYLKSKNSRIKTIPD